MFTNYLAYVKDNPNHYWFKAKLFGWGWTPATREGWAVLLVFIGLIVGNAYRLGLFDPNLVEPPVTYLVQTALMVVLLLIICWRTGERPHWQWGVPTKKDHHKK